MVANAQWQEKAALITGASGGIGAAIAQKLAAEGLHVILLARREILLNDLAEKIRANGGQATVLPADLTIEQERIRVYQLILSRYQGVDVLVNNAGFGWYGFTQDMPWSVALDMLKVNISALVQFTMMFLPIMKKRGSGRIINIGSIAGNIPSQGVALYSATKSFVNAFTTSLYRELSRTKVRVSVIRLGPVTTEFFKVMNQDKSRLFSVVERFGVSPDRVANGVWHLILHPKRKMYVPGWMRLIPFVEFLFGWIMDRLGPLDLDRSAMAG